MVTGALETDAIIVYHGASEVQQSLSIFQKQYFARMFSLAMDLVVRYIQGFILVTYCNQVCFIACYLKILLCDLGVVIKKEYCFLQ